MCTIKSATPLPQNKGFLLIITAIPIPELLMQTNAPLTMVAKLLSMECDYNVHLIFICAMSVLI